MQRKRILQTEQLESRVVLTAGALCCPDMLTQFDDAIIDAVPQTIQIAAEFPAAEETRLFDEVEYFGGRAEFNINSTQTPEVWAQGFTGAGVTVAVIDSGVDFTHPDLIDNIFANEGEIQGDGIDNDGNGYIDDYFGWDFVNNDANPFDGNGHGTHVAGTIAAGHNGFGTTGLAIDAEILPIRVLGDDGSGSSRDVADGITYAVDNGADIINLSLGGGYSPSILAALQYAADNDVFVVAAAGNEAQNTASFPARHSATLDNVISVGASTSSGNRASFSNQPGSGVIQVDAPGANIVSTVPGGGYSSFSGTSMAAPHVAALAALTLSADPTLSAETLRNVIVAGANIDVNGSLSLGGINANATVAIAAGGQSLEQPVAVPSMTAPVVEQANLVPVESDPLLSIQLVFDLGEETTEEFAEMDHVSANVIDRIIFETSEAVAFADTTAGQVASQTRAATSDVAVVGVSNSSPSTSLSSINVSRDLATLPI